MLQILSTYTAAYSFLWVYDNVFLLNLVHFDILINLNIFQLLKLTVSMISTILCLNTHLLILLI